MNRTSILYTLVVGVGLTGTALAAGHLSGVDTDGDGAISQAEFDAKRVATFNTHDTNGDGVLSPDEFIAMNEARQAARKARRQQWMFNRVDADGDGVISDEELAAKANKRFSRMDADGDGVISEEERKAMRKKHHGMMGRHHGKGMASPADG